jgi:hypothetical protein
MLEVLNGKPNITFEVPGGIVTAAVDTVSGYAAHGGYPSRMEKFIVGTEPSEDPVHVKLKVCKTDGKLATPSDISSGNYEEKEYFVFKEEDPFAKLSGVNKWQEGILSWTATQGDSRYHPPTDYCGTSNPVSVEFVSPKNRASDLPNKFTIEARADSINDIIQLELEVDGVKVRTFTKPPFRYEVDLSEGVYTLKAKAKDSKGNESERSITVGVNVAWDYSPFSHTDTHAAADVHTLPFPCSLTL